MEQPGMWQQSFEGGCYEKGKWAISNSLRAMCCYLDVQSYS